eukprot:TRINITY_DN11905_c0_g1_i1.p1 TRINITY_DN11905_c0_g1~~TRINITY_DN11905_c0_g1_i1.p1  ORF type:complete len:110 (+),score=9.40 TRINITY_DN11905_c0_g1_i1:116-445(+)
MVVNIQINKRSFLKECSLKNISVMVLEVVVIFLLFFQLKNGQVSFLQMNFFSFNLYSQNYFYFFKKKEFYLVYHYLVQSDFEEVIMLIQILDQIFVLYVLTHNIQFLIL